MAKQVMQSAQNIRVAGKNPIPKSNMLPMKGAVKNFKDVVSNSIADKISNMRAGQKKSITRGLAKNQRMKGF